MILYYLLIISVIAGIVFASDKQKARSKKRRIPEKRLHLFELAGGVFAVLVLMFVIRHKNRKSSYYIYTWLILVLWLGILYAVCVQNLFGHVIGC